MPQVSAVPRTRLLLWQARTLPSFSLLQHGSTGHHKRFIASNLANIPFPSTHLETGAQSIPVRANQSARQACALRTPAVASATQQAPTDSVRPKISTDDHLETFIAWLVANGGGSQMHYPLLSLRTRGINDHVHCHYRISNHAQLYAVIIVQISWESGRHQGRALCAVMPCVVPVLVRQCGGLLAEVDARLQGSPKRMFLR